MVRDVDVRGSHLVGHDRAHRARLPAPAQLRGAGAARALAAAGGRDRRARVRRHEPGGEGGADDASPRRRERAHEGHLARPLDARDRRRLGQGRRRQVDAHREPRRGVRPARSAGRRARRRRLRALDPAHAGRPPAAGGGRPHDRPARPRRPEADVDRLLPGRERAGDVARADAAPGARAVPVGRPLGRAGHAARGHASRDRRRLHLARAAAAARGGRRRDDAAAGGAAGSRPGRADGPHDEHAPPRRRREHVVPRRDRRGDLRLRRGRGARRRARRAAAGEDPARPAPPRERGPRRAARLGRPRGRGVASRSSGSQRRSPPRVARRGSES